MILILSITWWCSQLNTVKDNDFEKYSYEWASKALEKDYTSALYYLDKAIEIEPNSAKDLWVRWVVKMELWMPDEAMVDLNNSIRINNQDSHILLLRAKVKYFLWDYKWVMEDIDLSISIDNNLKAHEFKKFYINQKDKMINVCINSCEINATKDYCIKYCSCAYNEWIRLDWKNTYSILKKCAP